MGLFDWLRPRPALAITCWIDAASRARGFVQAVADDVARGANVLVVGHWKDALVEAGQALASAGIPFETRAQWSVADTQRLAMPPTGAVFAVLASSLPNVPEERVRAAPLPDAAPVSLRLCGLHVLPAANERVERFARTVPARTRVAVAVSFDDPIMQEFASPWVKSMLAGLGLRADKPIENAMVSKGLQRALQKLAKRATGNVPCDSLQEWMQRNLRS